MPIREPRIELDRQLINSLLGWSGVSIASICKFVRTITEASYVRINTKFVYNRGEVVLEDSIRREKQCWIISIWDSQIGTPESTCLFQQPVPVKVRFND